MQALDGEAGKFAFERAGSLLNNLRGTVAGDRARKEIVARFERDPELAAEELRTLWQDRLT